MNWFSYFCGWSALITPPVVHLTCGLCFACPVAPYFGPVSAAFHIAPLPAMVFSLVQEQPATVIAIALPYMA